MARKKSSGGTPIRTANPNVMGLRAEVVEQPITETLEVNYMPYAMSVIVSRAIPEIDGFKPSHRKLLYTMYQMKLLGGARTKSANVVGQTMKLNPHGDAAIYDTLVRLSRGYGALLHPPVDSKGNFGKVYSRDMAWAASRYTEVRLDGICNEIFRDIEQDTVDFVDSYDGRMKEPTLLPTTFPNVLVAANQGIAVGMASNLCGFNLGEVCDTTIAFLKDSNHDILSTLLGPDLPTGGELLYDEAALKEIYETGRGSFRVRARWRYLKAENMIEIYEIPYSTTTEAILDKVSELTRAGRFREISDMRDETDLNGMKLTIDLKRGTDPDVLMARLFKATPLLDSQSCNFNILIDGRPRVMGVREILQEWTSWRMKSVQRRTAFDLNRKKEKLHLLEGLQSILLDIDRAIRIIRETEEEAMVVPNLMTGFGIDQVQAEYVADIRLRNINREYILRRTKESEALSAEIADLEEVLRSPERVRRIIIRELQEVRRKYAVPRRTAIVYEHERKDEPDGEEPVPEYPVHIFLSRHGYLKKITPQSLRMSGDQKYKEGDGPCYRWESTSRAEVLVLTNRYQCYRGKLSEIPDTKASLLGDYLPTRLGMEPEERIIWACLPGDYRGSLAFFYSNGKAARVELSAYQGKRKKLSAAYSDKASLVNVIHLTEEMEVVLISDEGRCMILHTSMLKFMATRSSQGVQAMALKRGQKVVRAMSLEDSDIFHAARYRVRSLPGRGLPLDIEDRQIGFLGERRRSEAAKKTDPEAEPEATSQPGPPIEADTAEGEGGQLSFLD